LFHELFEVFYIIAENMKNMTVKTDINHSNLRIM